jgi:dTDP-4-amino-4,6-dideoxygalactose transaminase
MSVLATPTTISAATQTAVPFTNLERHHEPIADDLRAAFDRIMGSSQFILGSEVEAFEAEFAAYCGVAHCVGVASGTAALTLALIAAGIGRGDEVIVPGHTFIASVLAVVHAGATPVFCDVESGTGLIDPDSAARAITSRTAALMAVHLYGQCCDMDALDTIATRHSLLVLEDAAQAHGATFRRRRTGSLGKVAGFSFYPSKNLGALGDGGAICTGDASIARRARQLRDLGQRAKGEHVEVGFNERLDALQAALLRLKLPHLDAANTARRGHAARYREALGDRMRLLEERPQTPANYHLFPVRVDDRRHAASFLAAAGIETAVHYARPAYAHAAWDGVLQRRWELPESDAWAREELSLPLFPELEPWETERVIAACEAWMDEPERQR